MAITAQQIKALREQTGAGMMDCKNALVETKGDEKKAAKLLKEKGLAALEKRSERATGEGLIVVKGDEKKLAVAELVCETDFVAKNAEFVQAAKDVLEKVFSSETNEITQGLKDIVLNLATRMRENMSVSRVACIKAKENQWVENYVHHDGKMAAFILFSSDKPQVFSDETVKSFAHECCLHLVAYTPKYLAKNDVEQSYIDEQKEIFEGQVAKMDKPEKIKAGIVKGKINKHLSEVCFLEQPYINNEKISVEKAMNEVSKKAGGKLKVEKMYLWKVGE